MRRFLPVVLCLILLCPGASAQKGSSSRPSSSGSSSRSSFSGSSAPPKPSFSGSSKPAAASSSPTKPTFSGGSTPKPAATGSKPTASYDAHAAKAQRHAESRASLPRAAEPKTSYKTKSGKTYPIHADAPPVAKLRNDLSHDAWANRSVRQHTIYHHYYDQPVIHYHDPYSNLFWLWMLDQSVERQAAWAYHHKDTMDATRYQEMLSRNKELEMRVKLLEKQGVQTNPTYTPEGVDADLQYSDEYVDAVVNPQAEVTTPAQESHTVGMIFGILLLIVLAVVVVLIIVAACVRPQQ